MKERKNFDSAYFNCDSESDADPISARLIEFLRLAGGISIRLLASGHPTGSASHTASAIRVCDCLPRPRLCHADAIGGGGIATGEIICMSGDLPRGPGLCGIR